MKRRIISSLLAIILMISVVAVGASAAAAVDPVGRAIGLDGAILL